MSSGNNSSNPPHGKEKEKRSFNDIMSYWAVKDDKLPATKSTSNSNLLDLKQQQQQPTVNSNNSNNGDNSESTSSTPTPTLLSTNNNSNSHVKVDENQNEISIKSLDEKFEISQTVEIINETDSSNNSNGKNTKTTVLEDNIVLSVSVNSSTAYMTRVEQEEQKEEQNINENTVLQTQPIRSPASCYSIGELRASDNGGYDNQPERPILNQSNNSGYDNQETGSSITTQNIVVGDSSLSSSSYGLQTFSASGNSAYSTSAYSTDSYSISSLGSNITSYSTYQAALNNRNNNINSNNNSINYNPTTTGGKSSYSIGYSNSSYGVVSSYSSADNQNYTSYLSSVDVEETKKPKKTKPADLDDEFFKGTLSNIYKLGCLPELQDDSFNNKSLENNWNEIFQNTLDLPDSEEKFRKLSNIANDFVYCADTFGKIIISELHLPAESKTIKPLALGGVAGGLKFKCQDIIFKFVVDTELIPGIWMYGESKRSDEKAQKSAGHEIKGLNHFMELSNGTIRFPLMATIDYRGYRILAISSLPISKQTIVYGSCDGGQTVHDSDTLINNEMERMAKLLNLRGHVVGLNKKTIFGPGDIEVHKGFDGRYYMVDFARIFPPEYPCTLKKYKQIGREIFYSMCRPELVLRSKVPLSSDGFSGWQTGDNITELNDDIIKVSELLHKEIIPQCISTLESSVMEPAEEQVPADHSSFTSNSSSTSTVHSSNDGSNSSLLDDDQQYLLTLKDAGYSKGSAERDYTQKAQEIIKLLNFIHSKGINIRYLGLICQNITNRFIRNLFFTEVVARVWKKIIRARIREMMDLTKRPSEGPYKQIISDIFELILSTNKSKNREFWTSTSPGNFKYIALKVFPKCLSQSDKSQNLDLRSVIDCKLLVYRLIQMLNIRVNANAFSQFLSNPKYIISDKDIEEVGSVVKYPNIIDFAAGSVLIYESQRIANNSDTPPVEIMRWIDNSQIKLQNALRSMPLSFKVLLKLSLTYLLRANISTDFRESIERLKNAIVLIKQASFAQKNQPKLLALHSMIQLKLATLYLFYSRDLNRYEREIHQAKEKLYSAITQDYWSVEEFLDQSLPMHLTNLDAVGCPIGFTIDFNEKRKINEMISLGLMRIEVAKDQSDQSVKLLNFIDYVFKKIYHVREFSVPMALSRIIATDQVEQIVSLLTQSTFLHLSKVTISSRLGLNIISMKNLKQLRFSGVFFSSKNPAGAEITNYNQFLTRLLSSNPQLELLYLESKSIEDESFEGTHQYFANLKSLSLVSTYITTKTAVALAPYLTNITALSFSGSSDIGDDGLIACLQSIKSLKHLSMCMLNKLTDKSGLVLAQNAADLEDLYLIRSRYRPETIAEIVKNAPKLSILDVSSSSANQLMIEGLTHHGAKNLTRLNLSYLDPIDTEDFIEVLANLGPNLKFLHLPRAHVSTQAMWNLIRKLNDLEDLKFPDRFHLPTFLDHFNDPNFKEDHEEPLYNLKTLDLTMSIISISSLKKILDFTPLLESLCLSAAQFVDDNSYCYDATDETLIELGPLIYNLRELNLSNHPLEKRQIVCLLSRCPMLRTLHLWGCKKISAQDIYDLGVMHPHISID
ncbi:hypothetical protein CYY_008312 [Polysphondylium violaceum]|uniref:Clu domain-containing protein n=1 Tax=Polysphondylium violaceum TaxID=133409 RepID=A0A8J4PQK9_9MYCE|nr:hypothetical protein CYY_008312 [Polysphondylium violaceum]